MTNQSGGWAHPLRAVAPANQRLDKYANIIEDCLAITQTLNQLRYTMGIRCRCFCDEHNEPFEEIEDSFWDLYNANRDELPDLLHKYICDNRDVFAPFSIRG